LLLLLSSLLTNNYTPWHDGIGSAMPNVGSINLATMRTTTSTTKTTIAVTNKNVIHFCTNSH